MNDLRILRYGISLWIVLALCVCGQAAEQEELPDQMSKVSYGIGMNLGRQWRQQEIPINIDLLMRGLRDSMEGNPTLMTEEEMQTTLMSYQTQHRARMEEKRKQKAKENLEAGEKFLAENKTKTGVVTLPSGLQYKIINEGQGDSPKAHDQVTVHYRGTLIDGTEFDNSYKGGTPATFAVNGVIKGWTEALQLMKPGAKWELYVPAALGYGERGGGPIGPNAALIFEVELVSVTPQEPPTAPEPVTSDIIKVPSKEEMDKGAQIQVIKKEDLEKLLKEQKQTAPDK